ncbi:hypothetical protein KA517_03840 [Candidatus Gracilibacteria bacterium]|nr:hypothetical protein [Candidatus Gracilibacteria bacterium]
MWHYLVTLGNNTATPNTTTTAPSGILPINGLRLIPGVQPIESIDTGTLINEMVAYAIVIAGLLSVIFMLWGGIQFIISGGKEDKTKSAVGTIRYAIIGLIVTILSVSVINFIGKLFNFDLVNYVNFEHILEIINNIVNFRFS